MIKSISHLVYVSVFETFFILNACLAFCFQVSKHNYFWQDILLGLFILNLSFVAKLKLNVFESSQVDYVMFSWFTPIVFHLILHIQRFLVMGS